jgi:hypothetical protein
MYPMTYIVACPLAGKFHGRERKLKQARAFKAAHLLLHGCGYDD